MDLSTTYLGLKLRTPLVPSASPLSEDIHKIRHMEEAGAAAVVLHSIFQEQLLDGVADTATPPHLVPGPEEFSMTPDEYLDHIRKAKENVDIPIIGSINVTAPGKWLDFARQIEQAGADALELTIYYIPTDLTTPGADIEANYVQIVTEVKKAVSLPVSIKISPFFSNLANVARQLDEAGADALVLFNRFYQPDIFLETLEVRPHLLLSTSQSLYLPMRWIAILYSRISADLAATSGIHHSTDVIKMLMSGASITMLCSILLRHGIDSIRSLEQGLKRWLQSHEYESVEVVRGMLSQQNCEDPSAFERLHYTRALKGYYSNPASFGD